MAYEWKIFKYGRHAWIILHMIRICQKKNQCEISAFSLKHCTLLGEKKTKLYLFLRMKKMGLTIYFIRTLFEPTV